MLFVVVNYTILLVGWFVPWLHRARVGSYDVVRLSGQDTTLAKDKFSSHLPTNSAAPHSNNFTGGFFCKYDLEKITLFGANQHTALLHQQHLLLQLLLGGFLLFLMGGATSVLENTCFQRKPMCPPVTVVRICFLPCCPLFSSPHCCLSVCALIFWFWAFFSLESP